MPGGTSLSGRTLTEVWEAGLSLFSAPASLHRHDSERGVAFELPGLTLVLERADETSPPPRYAYPGLIGDYTERLFGSERDTSLLYRRMRAWPTANGTALDQIAQATAALRASPDSRAAAFSLWRPEEEYETGYPVSPVSGCFRVIDEAVHLLLVARSVDFWVGAVPELTAFARLSCDVAASLNREPGGLVYHVWSAHVYENDCLAHLMDGGGS